MNRPRYVSSALLQSSRCRVLQGDPDKETVQQESGKASVYPGEQNYVSGENNGKGILAEMLKQLLKRILLDTEAQWPLLNSKYREHIKICAMSLNTPAF